MSTPGNKFNYNSPYAHPVNQYPSQSEDYISLDMGGANKQYPAFSSNEKTPSHGSFNYYQQNSRNSNSKANRRNLFNNNYSQQNRRQSFNQQRYGSGNGGEWSHQKNIKNSNVKREKQQNFQHDKQGTKSSGSYIHPSMTEDPWFELTQRLRALEKSQISLKDVSPPLEKRATANVDEEVESGASD